jgi:hypothetical protein
MRAAAKKSDDFQRPVRLRITRAIAFFSSPFLWMQKKKTATQTFSFSVRMRPELDAGVQLHWRWKSS